jgi:hypothetical protein
MAEREGRYSWNAEDYTKHSSGQYEWAKELIPKLRRKETKVCSILVVEMERSQQF